MEKCQCIHPGFCEFFKQEMTYDPPNWQWCQNATPEERAKYKIDCDKKHARRLTCQENPRFITVDSLISDCRQYLLPKLVKEDIRGIAAIPRSGYIPAATCAVALNVPMYNIINDRLELSAGACDFGGFRMSGYSAESGQIVVLDDTVFSGTAMRKMKERLGLNDTVYAAVYVTPECSKVVDIFGLELKPPHLLDWHFFNSGHTERTLFDLDGIFCPDAPPGTCDRNSEDKYIEHISNVEPIYHRLPKLNFCGGIVTARLDKHRDITEEWLEKHGIRYGSLTMYPTEDRDTRDSNHMHEAAKYKADVYSKSEAEYFMESEQQQAALIQKMTKKKVVCPNDLLS